MRSVYISYFLFSHLFLGFSVGIERILTLYNIKMEMESKSEENNKQEEEEEGNTKEEEEETDDSPSFMTNLIPYDTIFIASSEKKRKYSFYVIFVQ